MVKLRNGALAVLLVFAAIVYFPEIQGWYGGDNDDDGRRTIQLIALSSNDSLRVTAILISSVNGHVLSLTDHEIADNSWNYAYEVGPTESIHAKLDVWVHVEELGDRSSVRCKIIDDGHVVQDERAQVRYGRISTSQHCQYTS